MTESKSLRILLIEDTLTDQELILHYLQHIPDCEMNVDCARDLKSGLKKIAEGGWDAVLLDLHLPDSLGLETCRSVHQQTQILPLIVLTGTRDQELVSEALKYGAQDFLVKGEINSEIISRAIRYAIERMEAQKERWQEQERIRLITEQLPAIVWSTDADLDLMTCRGSGALVAATTLFEDPGMTLMEFFKTTDPEYPPFAAHRKALNDFTTTMEFRVEEEDFFIRIEPMYDLEEAVIGTIGLAMNVTSHRRLEAEMLAAKHIQNSLTPDVNEVHPGFEIAGSVTPADETGGDYVDTIKMLDNTIGIVVADVSGHGLGPALLVVEFRAYLRPLAQVGTDIQEILTIVNKFLVEDFSDNHFVTAFYGRLDYERRRLIYAGAGHTGYLLKANGKWKVLESTGHPLGLLDTAKIEQIELPPLDSGDLLLVMTDGIFEGKNPARELMGIDRVLKIVEDNRDRTSQEIVRILKEASLEFIAPASQKDDMTVLVVKCNFEDEQPS